MPTAPYQNIDKLSNNENEESYQPSLKSFKKLEEGGKLMNIEQLEYNFDTE
jgi:hypothetical protein